jgi:protein-L-isoaspartate(D-aspartate) O-methyltransferase
MRWRRRLQRQPEPPEPEPALGGDPQADARRRMVVEQLQARGLRDPELLSAFATVPRHVFVESIDAYGDHALPVGAGQTISQPYVVAVMTAAARPPGPDGYRRARVLEIGTGSGYQAAVLAELGAEVVSIERFSELAASARQRLAETGYAQRVTVLVGDGTEGWPERAPYKSILVTAAGPSVPEPLLEQLDAERGRLVMPVGSRQHQTLTLVQRQGDDFESRPLDPVVFVPLVGSHGFEAD